MSQGVMSARREGGFYGGAIALTAVALARLDQTRAGPIKPLIIHHVEYVELRSLFPMP